MATDAGQPKRGYLGEGMAENKWSSHNMEAAIGCLKV